MKPILFTLLVITFSLQQSFAISFPKQNLALKAINGKHQKIYKIGNFIKVFVQNSNKIKGQLVAISADSISLKISSKNNILLSIAIVDINAIEKLHKKGRKGWITIFAILIALTIFAFAINAGFLSLFILLYSISGFYVEIPYLIVNFLSDPLSKKSKKKGWSFTTSE